MNKIYRNRFMNYSKNYNIIELAKSTFNYISSKIATIKEKNEFADL